MVIALVLSIALLFDMRIYGSSFAYYILFLRSPTAEDLYRLCSGKYVQIEAMEDVERAYVHVDYESRDVPEHKVERQMHNQTKGPRKLIRRRTFL